MINHILLCTDGSGYASVCARYGAWLAALSGAKITALYVTDIRQFEVPFVADFSGSLGIQPYQDLVSQFQALEKQKAQVVEQNLRKALADEGFTGEVEFLHRTGLLVDHVTELETQVDLVLLGKRGATADVAIEHLGSNLERVVRASRRPCLVTSRAYREVNRVALAYDGGPSTRRALEFLADFEPWHDREIHLVSCITKDLPEAEAEKLTTEAREFLERAGCGEVVEEVLYGEVDEAIAEYVRSEEVDLLLIGAYGHSRIRHLLIGSVTTAMIRDCRIPVLCFR